MSVLPKNNNQEARRYIKELKSDLELSIDKNKSSQPDKVIIIPATEVCKMLVDIWGLMD